MTTLNNQESRACGHNALKALNSLQPPDGIQERVMQNIAERVRHQQLSPALHGCRKYAWELWAGATIALIAAAIIVCIFALQARRVENPPLAANMPTHKIAPTSIRTGTEPAANPPRKVPHTNRTEKSRSAAPIPHTPPPQPLTAQERLLLRLANTPSLAAGLAQTQTISQHGLGANALFELDHEQLQPMRESKLLQPLPPLPHNLP